MNRIWLLIPAYNEMRNLPALLDSWRENGRAMGREVRFLFVDDASTDGTPDWLSSAGDDVEVIRQVTNGGPGAAFERGFREIVPRLQDGEILLTLEADNTSDASIASQLIHAVESGADLALAACYAEGGGVVGTTLWRKFLSAAANTLLRTAFRLPHITTFTSFYRAYGTGLLRRLSGTDGLRFRMKGFVCMAEFLLAAAVEGARIVEVPMVLEAARRQGPSNMKVMRTIMEYIKFLVLRAPLWIRRWSPGR